MIVLKDDDGLIINAFDTVAQFKAFMKDYLCEINNSMAKSGLEPIEYKRFNAFEIARDYCLEVEFY